MCGRAQQTEVTRAAEIRDADKLGLDPPGFPSIGGAIRSRSAYRSQAPATHPGRSTPPLTTPPAPTRIRSRTPHRPAAPLRYSIAVSYAAAPNPAEAPAASPHKPSASLSRSPRGVSHSTIRALGRSSRRLFSRVRDTPTVIWVLVPSTDRRSKIRRQASGLQQFALRLRCQHVRCP
jgi:hypothetical protein